jgi:hypothetical protein
MLEHMRACDDRDKFPRFLPAGTRIAFKTGSLANTRTAAGIIECSAGPVAVCVLSGENEDTRWVPDNAGNLLCAEVARAVFDHFQGTTQVNVTPVTSSGTAASSGAQNKSAAPPARQH